MRIVQAPEARHYCQEGASLRWLGHAPRVHRGAQSRVTFRLELAALVALCSFGRAVSFDWTWAVGGQSTGERQHATDELDGDTFEPFLAKHPVTAVLFYAPWCFYSQQVMGPWDTAGQKLALHDPPVSVVKIDAHRYDEIGMKYGVNAFPTMKLFVDETVFDYDQEGRSWQHIVKWVNHHLDRDHVLKSVEDADSFLHDNDLNVIGLFADDYNSTIFTQTSRHFSDVMFAEVRGTEIATKVSEHVAHHALFKCETVDIGQGSQNQVQVTLPRKGMQCSDQPRNPQRPDWTDKFMATVEGEHLKVKRTDSTSGWLQNLQLKCCDDESVVPTKEAEPIPVPSIVMFMPHDERFARYDGGLEDLNALNTFITARRSPLVMHLTANTAEKLLGGSGQKTPVLFLVTSGKEEALEKTLKEAAGALRGRVSVCFAGSVSQIERRFMELAGADDASLPIVTVVEVQSGMGPRHSLHKYRLDPKGLTVPKVVKFIDDYEAGRLKHWLRSEPEPSKEDQEAEKPVGVLVGSNFADITQDKSIDVLVDFYAPWCGHCRKFEPVYKALAKKLAHVKSLRIMKIDATRNDIEALTLEGFPTVALFPAGERKSHLAFYQGPRQPDDMIRWLHDHCTIKFSDKAPPKVEASPEEPVSGLLTESEDDL